MPRRAFLATSALALAFTVAFGSSSAQAACRPTPAETQTVKAVASAALDRLEIADDVAASKWLSGKPVADPVREEAVLEDTVARAKEQGVDPVAAKRIMQAQITASKVVQYALIARWRAHPDLAPTAAPDLSTSIRPRINAVDARLVTAIGAASAALDDRSCTHLVKDVRDGESRGLDAVHRQALRVALRTVCNPES